MIVKLTKKQIVDNCFSWIKYNTISKYYTIKLDGAMNYQERRTAESFRENNPEIFNLINTLLSTISNEQAQSISIAKGLSSLFITYMNGDKTLTFSKKELVSMLENFESFKKAYCIYADFLKSNGFKCITFI